MMIKDFGQIMIEKIFESELLSFFHVLIKKNVIEVQFLRQISFFTSNHVDSIHRHDRGRPDAQELF